MGEYLEIAVYAVILLAWLIGPVLVVYMLTRSG